MGKALAVEKRISIFSWDAVLTNSIIQKGFIGNLRSNSYTTLTVNHQKQLMWDFTWGMISARFSDHFPKVAHVAYSLRRAWRSDAGQVAEVILLLSLSEYVANKRNGKLTNSRH